MSLGLCIKGSSDYNAQFVFSCLLLKLPRASAHNLCKNLIECWLGHFFKHPFLFALSQLWGLVAVIGTCYSLATMEQCLGLSWIVFTINHDAGCSDEFSLSFALLWLQINICRGTGGGGRGKRSCSLSIHAMSCHIPDSLSKDGDSNNKKTRLKFFPWEWDALNICRTFGGLNQCWIYSFFFKRI